MEGAPEGAKDMEGADDVDGASEGASEQQKDCERQGQLDKTSVSSEFCCIVIHKKYYKRATYWSC